jgi:hypothetical protein
MKVTKLDYSIRSILLKEGMSMDLLDEKQSEPVGQGNERPEYRVTTRDNFNMSSDIYPTPRDADNLSHGSNGHKDTPYIYKDFSTLKKISHSNDNCQENTSQKNVGFYTQRLSGIHRSEHVESKTRP